MSTAKTGRSRGRVALLPPEHAGGVAAEVGVPAELVDRNHFRVLLHRQGVAKAINDLLYAQPFGAALDGRLRELVIMRIGWMTGCDYEWTQRWPVAQTAFGCSPGTLPPAPWGVRGPASSW